MSDQPVTRIASFKFHPHVTPSQKGDRARAFLALYAQHKDLIIGMPKGGKPLLTPLQLKGVQRDAEWDTLFTVTFKSEEARRAFDEEPGHDRLKEETDPLLMKVFVYDYVEEENLGW
ncbi:hypothetical protein EJ04DRAFT_494953 [Polyplosphaeria fusca]|uniref:Stress-response A/B barrel domain-containing protein n=1 Tax=Polyplosphaeria fusca TaxID=682080 RepID=A0A9P4V2R3_9PLEO|nr:hypothetical protein EJ04DRAFT_494953 [Polyplosphaeria fusca]